MSSNVTLKFPPGMMRNGTRYESKGRWYDGNLVRWYEGTLQAIGGWVSRGIAITNPIRGVIAWRRSSSATVRFVYGTYLGMYVEEGGTANGPITPTGYGGGDTSTTIWHFDTFGDLVIGVATTDKHIAVLDYNVGDVTLGIIGTLSTTAIAIVATPERFVFALGANGDSRLVKWGNQEDYDPGTVASATNQAGDFILATPGSLVCGKRAKTETLIWTDADIWAARYIGGTLVYRFDQIGTGCGIIAPLASAVSGSRAIWMGQSSFYLYDGYVKAIPCEVGDYVFSNLNRTYAHKVCCVPNADQREVTWYYPHGAATENSNYVTLHEDGHWVIGVLARTSGIDRGPHTYPIICSANGKAYEHEKGTTYLDPAGAAIVPTVESGPYEIAQGDNVMCVLGIIPDDKTVGDVTATFYTAMYPDESEGTFGPYTLTKKTDVRFTARQVRVKLLQVNAGWRWGSPRLMPEPAGLR